MLRFESERGVIEIAHAVVAKIVGYCATKCFGVVGMVSRNPADGIVGILKRDYIDRGVKVTADGKTLSIDLHILVQHGVNLRAISESITQEVVYGVEHAIDAKVSQVNVCIDAMRV